MPHQSLLKPLLLTALSFSPLVASQWFAADGVANHFILYNGTISGTFSHSDSFPSNCDDMKLGSFSNAVLAVGVNAPWDKNPFFFDLHHTSSEGGGFISFTDDAIYNLDFTSAASVCMKDGEVCGFVEFDPEFKATQVLNLDDAKVEKTTVDGKAGYSVSGDEDTFVSDGTITSQVDVARPDDVDLELDCMFQEHFAWNASTPFKYTVKFTNSSSTASLSLTAPHGSLTLDFSGDRQDGGDSTLANTGKAIQLDTSDASPKFTYTDGSEITFGDDDADDESSGESSSPGLEPASTSGSGSTPSSSVSGSAPTETGGVSSLTAGKSMTYWALGGIVSLFALHM